MKVLLLSPPYLPEYMRNARCDFVSLSKTQWYPIWLGYCGAFLEKHGYEVMLVDAPAYGYDHDKTDEVISGFGPDMIVVYSGRMSEDNDIEFAERMVKKLSCKAVFAGPYLSIHPEEVLRKTTTIPYAVKGELEYPILELLEGKAPEDIKNLSYKADGGIKTNPIRALLTGEQLDEIPFITEFFSRHLDLDHYKAPSEFHPYIDLMTGRGCAWGMCTFCLWVHSFIPGQVYNTRSAKNVVEEFKFIDEKMPHIRSVMIQDDTMTDEWGVELSEAFIEAGIKVPWSCYARGNLKYETLVLLKKAGCRNLHVGFESADPKVLENIKKGITVERMTKFCADAKKAGLQLHADFAIGFNGETPEGIERTIKWASELDPHTAQFQLMIPFPSTPFYDTLEKNNWISDGAPSYPGLSNEDMRASAKKAYRSFYLSWRHMKNVIAHPYEQFFGRLDTISRALPAILWKRW